MKSSEVTVWASSSRRKVVHEHRRPDCLLHFELEALERRYLLSAQLDPTFGQGGHAWAPGQTGTNYDLSEGDWQYFAVRPEGRIIVSGDAYPVVHSDHRDVALRQFSPDGVEDPGFRADLPGDIIPDPAQVVPQLDGKTIVLLNQSIMRLNADGSRDTTFAFAKTAQMT